MRTCLLAARAARTRVWCRYGHVPITTASTSGSSMISDQLAAACMPNCQGNARTFAESSLVLHVKPGSHSGQYASSTFMTMLCNAALPAIASALQVQVCTGMGVKINWAERTLPIPNSAAAFLDDSNDLFATETTCTPFIFCRFGM